MVIVVSGQSVVNNLFKNNHEMVDQIFVSPRIDFGLNLEVIESTGHHTRVLVAKCFFHLLIHLINWLDLVEFQKNHHSFFPNHLMLVI